MKLNTNKTMLIEIPAERIPLTAHQIEDLNLQVLDHVRKAQTICLSPADPAESVEGAKKHCDLALQFAAQRDRALAARN